MLYESLLPHHQNPSPYVAALLCPDCESENDPKLRSPCPASQISNDCPRVDEEFLATCGSFVAAQFFSLQRVSALAGLDLSAESRVCDRTRTRLTRSLLHSRNQSDKGRSKMRIRRGGDERRPTSLHRSKPSHLRENC